MRKIIVLSALFVMLGLGLCGFQLIIKAWSSSPAQSNGVSINDVTVTEGDSGTINASFIVSIAQPIDFTARFDFATANGTATVADNDYVARTGSVTFGFGLPTSQTVDIVINGDTSIEGNETFLVNLTRPPETDLGILDGQGVCTIVNDDSAVCTITCPTVQPVNTGPNATQCGAVVNYPAPTFSASCGTVTCLPTSGSVFPVGTSTVTCTTTAGPGCSFSITVVDNTPPPITCPANTTVTAAPGQCSAVVNYATPVANDNCAGATTACVPPSGSTFPQGLTTVSCAARDASNNTANCNFRVTVIPNLVITPTSRDFPLSGGTGTVEVTAATGCGWTAISNNAFITITQGANGTGSGTVNYSVASGTGAARTGTMTIAGRTFTVIQGGGQPSLSINNTVVTEGSIGTINAMLTVSLSSASASEIKVDYQTADGSPPLDATAPDDYVSKTGTLIFPANSTAPMTINILVNGDLTAEPDEHFFVNLSNPVGAVILAGQGECRITNDDGEIAIPDVSITDTTMVEGDSGVRFAVFTVSLSAPGRFDVVVDYETADGTATARRGLAALQDYKPQDSVVDFPKVDSPKPLKFPAGSTNPQHIIIEVNGDGTFELDEAFFVNLKNLEFATSSDAQGMCTILNDDNLTAGPKLSIEDVRVKEPENGVQNAEFTVRLFPPSSSTVTVDFATINGTAAAPGDYESVTGTLTFPGGSTSPMTPLVIPIKGDGAFEPTEIFLVNLSNAVGAVIKDHQGIAVIDDFDGLPRLEFLEPASIAGLSVAEGDSGAVEAVFVLILRGSSRLRVTVDYSTEDAANFIDSATAGVDYNNKSGTLTFRGDGDRQEIRVQIIGDRIPEQAERFRVRLSNLRNTFVYGDNDPSRLCEIIDNDRIPLSVCSADVPKSIPDATPGAIAGSVESTLTISEDIVVQRLSVGVFIEHPDVSDLEVSLVSPSGQITKVMSLLKSSANIGAGCTQAQFCVLTDGEGKRLFDSEPPYVGRFQAQGENWRQEIPGGVDRHEPPGGGGFPPMDKFKGENARGDWKLIVRDLKNDNTGTIRCWCLIFEGGRTICAVQPNAIQVPRFTYITPTATVLVNGAPVRGANVSFTINVLGQGLFGPFGPFQTNQNGQAFMTSYTSRGQTHRETEHIIEARVTLNSETLIGRSHVFWYDVVCPTVIVGTDSANGEAAVSAARSFRDDVLAKTPRGQRYTQLYYQFSAEAVRIMMFNPMLMLRSREILSRYKPVIESMVNGQGAVLTQGDLEEIDSFLNSFASKGGDDFQEAIKGISNDLRDPQMHSEFNITVTDGPRRDLPVGDQLLSIKRIGGIMMLCGFSGLLFLGLTRRKALLKHTKRLMIALLLLTGLANWSYAISGPQRRNDRALRPSSSPTARSAPLSFESNQGQSDSQAKFISRGSGYNLFLMPGEAVFSLSTEGHGDAGTRREISFPVAAATRPPLAASQSTSSPSVLRMKLIGASAAPQISGLNRLPGARNYFIGNDPARWRANVPCFEKVKYESVYPGIDMVYYGKERELEYDFIVAPGADPKPIRIAFDGASSIRRDSSGDLVFGMGEAEVRQLKPVVYQEVNGVRLTVPARYVLSEVGLEEPGDRGLTLKTENSKLKTFQVGFEIGEYDKSRPLIIDPVLTYSTYLGGSGDDEGNSITVDSAGNAYIAGFTDSINFPVSNSPQSVFGGGQQDAFVTKLDPSGALVYSTYLGGNFQDNASGIAVDAAGNAYVTGFTGSTNFPVANAMQPTKNGLFNAFVTKLSPGGSIIYSTHLGGSGGDFGSSIAVDSAGNVYLAGVATSQNFPLSQAMQSTSGGAADIYVAKLNPSATQLLFSTYLGGSDNDGAISIALDSAGNVYVTGVTSSPNFPRASALKASHGGGVFDGFVAKLSSSGAQLIYSTYLGGSGEDRVFRIAVDSAGNAYVTGDTDSADFPVAAALQQTNAGSVDAFVTKINPSGASLIYSTYLGGSSIDGGTAIAVDAAGNSYVTGFTGSTNFPSVDPLQQAFGGGSFDAFAAKLSSSGATLDFCTYLGGSGIDAGFAVAVDAAANLYVMGQTDSTNFPTANPIQPAYGGGPSDVFVSKITAATVSGPRITGVSVSGKSLILTGSSFDNGAKILVDGQPQKTVNDAQNPSTTLIGKKAGKKISPGETVTLQVRNPDGRLSPEFHFTRPVGQTLVRNSQ